MVELVVTGSVPESSGGGIGSNRFCTGKFRWTGTLPETNRNHVLFCVLVVAGEESVDRNIPVGKPVGPVLRPELADRNKWSY